MTEAGESPRASVLTTAEMATETLPQDGIVKNRYMKLYSDLYTCKYKQNRQVPRGCVLCDFYIA